MCFMKAPKPNLPPKPDVPTPNESALKAEQLRRVRLAGSQGRASNVLTSPLGDPNFGKNARRVTLGVG